MTNEFQATYEDGILKLDAPLSLPEKARVLGVVTKVEVLDASRTSATRSELTDTEFERVLDEFSVHGCEPLPADFSRVDIYFEHD